jgi:fructokinase
MRDPDQQPVIVGLGEILWDLLPGGKQLGGAPANFAYHARTLGAQAYPVSAVGDDDLGHEIIDRLTALDLDPRYVAVVPGRPTGTVDVHLDDKGRPQFVIHENTAWDAIPFTDELATLAARADAVCFGTLGQRSPASRDTIRRFLEATKPDCLHAFDINLRQSYFDAEIIDTLLATADVVKLNNEELPVVAAMLEIDASGSDVFEYLLDRYGLRLIALTSGSRGSVLHAPGRRSEHPGRNVQVADTVGAGDAFTAATVIGLLKHHDLERINAFANTLAAHVCTKSGATPPIPDELRSALNSTNPGETPA